MIIQRLVLNGGYPDGVWACAGCGARLGDNDQSGPAFEHEDDCPEMTGLRPEPEAISADVVVSTTDVEPHALFAAAAVIDRMLMASPCYSQFHENSDVNLAKAALDAASPFVAAAERTRLYAELGNDHYVIFTEDGWTTEHSVECRLSGQMHRCAYHDAIAKVAHEFDPDMAGRWRITGIDSEGLPSLVRQAKARRAV